MRTSAEFMNSEVDLVVAALLSMACPLCPLQHGKDCGKDPLCRKLAERVAGGELSDVYGHAEG